MNKLQFPYKVKHYLDLGTQALDRDTARKLHHAREKALSRLPVRAGSMSLIGHGPFSLDTFWPAFRSVVALAVLAVGVVGVSYWNALEQANENVDVDTALLADDLPITAYLDRGFDTWLKDVSPQ
jgi:hypothetical protein